MIAVPVRFKCDENMPNDAARVLILAGYDTSSVVTQRLGGATDPVVASVCAREGRILLTLDLYFADIRRYPPAGTPGIIVLRPKRADASSIVQLCEALDFLLRREPIAGRLWVLTESGLRVRGE